MVLYSKLVHGPQFFENQILGCRDIKQNQSLIFFGTPCTPGGHQSGGYSRIVSG